MGCPPPGDPCQEQKDEGMRDPGEADGRRDRRHGERVDHHGGQRRRRIGVGRTAAEIPSRPATCDVSAAKSARPTAPRFTSALSATLWVCCIRSPVQSTASLAMFSPTPNPYPRIGRCEITASSSHSTRECGPRPTSWRNRSCPTTRPRHSPARTPTRAGRLPTRERSGVRCAPV